MYTHIYYKVENSPVLVVVTADAAAVDVVVHRQAAYIYAHVIRSNCNSRP